MRSREYYEEIVKGLASGSGIYKRRYKKFAKYIAALKTYGFDINPVNKAYPIVEKYNWKDNEKVEMMPMISLVKVDEAGKLLSTISFYFDKNNEKMIRSFDIKSMRICGEDLNNHSQFDGAIMTILDTKGMLEVLSKMSFEDFPSITIKF